MDHNDLLPRRRSRRPMGALASGLALLAVWAWGCAPALPPPPEDYDSLLRYLFAHMGDEDPAELAAGIESLVASLDDTQLRARGERGHSLAALEDDIVDGVDDVRRSAEGLEGLGVMTATPHSAQEIGCTLTWEGFSQIIEANFESYERVFDQDPRCFCSGACDRVEAESETISSWAGLVRMEAAYRIQFRWLESSRGPVLLHRFWLREPTGEDGGVMMQGSYYFGATVPSDTGSLRVHANWFAVDLGALEAAEDLVFTTTVDNLKNDATRLDAWIAENGAPRP